MATLIGLKESCTIPEKLHAQAVLKEQGRIGFRYPKSMAEVPAAVREYFEEVVVGKAEHEEEGED